MKKLIAVLLVTVTAAAFFVLSGCSGESQTPDSLKESAADVKANIFDADVNPSNPIAARIDKDHLYSKSEISSLGLKCNDDNPDAIKLLKLVEGDEISEFNYTSSKTAPKMIYKTSNPMGLSTEEVIQMFKDCGSTDDNLPLKAESDYILWGSTNCNNVTGNENSRCDLFMKNLLQYIE